MRDLADALERIAAGAQARADLTPAVAGRAVDQAARRRRGSVVRAVSAVAGVAAAAVLAVTMLGGPGRRTPPVGPDRTSTSSAAATPDADLAWPPARTVAALPACGDPAPVPTGPDDAALRLALQQPADEAFAGDQRVPLMATVVADRAAGYAELSGPASFAIVARDGAQAGKVVGLGSAGQPPAGPQWLGAVGYPQLALVAFRACEQAGSSPAGIVPAGTYDLFAILPLTRTFADDTWFGGPDPLLLASGAVPLTLGETLRTADPAPALRECGSSDRLVASDSGGLGLAIRAEPDGRGLTAVVAMTGAAAFADVRWVDIGWTASRDGVVVARGVVPPPQGPGFTVLPGTFAPESVINLDLNAARECATGAPLWDGGPVTVQVRGVVRVDLAPTQDGSTPTLLPLLSGGQWYTVDPQPVPASVPVLGEGQARQPGVLDQTSVQDRPGLWRVSQSWASPDTYQQLRAALVAAGLTVSSEELTGPDGQPDLAASAHFSRPDGLRMVVLWNTTSGDGTFTASWSIEVP